MKPWTCLAALAVLTSSCSCQSEIDFVVTMTCDEIMNGFYNSQFSERLSNVSRSYNLALEIDQMSSSCDPDPLFNIIFSLKDTIQIQVKRFKTPRTWWGAENECLNMGGYLAGSIDLEPWKSSVFDMTYVADTPSDTAFGKNCSALTKGDWKIVGVDCATKLPFMCIY